MGPADASERLTDGRMPGVERLLGHTMGPCDGSNRVERFDGIRGVKNAPDLVGEGVERDDLAPCPAPALCDGRIAPAPEAVLEGSESRFSGFSINGSINILQGGRDSSTVLVGDEVQAVA
jgi:hypothetical protein